MNKHTFLLIAALFVTPTISAINWQPIEEQTKNAVVQVHAYGDTTNPLEPFNKNQSDQKWAGSGFFIDEDGYFLTNYHVAGKTKRLEISMPSVSRQRFAAELVGCKPSRDVALCRLTPAGKTKFEAFLKKEVTGTNGIIPWLPLAQENRLNPAQEIMALGYPLADEFKRTIGHISGISSGISVSGNNNMLFCQISAAINSGNSGGPSVNEHGEVVGINTASAIGVGVEATHYMSPVHTFRHLIEEFKKHRILHFDLGIYFQPTTQNIIDALGCPTSGIYVTHAPAGSFAHSVGFRQGDIIMMINNQALDNDGLITTDWIDAKVPATDILEHLEVGAPIEAHVWRNNEALTLHGIMPAYAAPTISTAVPEHGHLDYRALGGLVVQPLRANHLELAYDQASRGINPQLYTFIKNPRNAMSDFIIITRVFNGTQAEHERALSAGSIITEINDQPVHTLADFDAQVQATKGDYITVKTSSGDMAALHIPTLLEEDVILRDQHRYDEAPCLTTLRSRAA